MLSVPWRRAGRASPVDSCSGEKLEGAEDSPEQPQRQATHYNLKAKEHR